MSICNLSISIYHNNNLLMQLNMNLHFNLHIDFIYLFRPSTGLSLFAQFFGEKYAWYCMQLTQQFILPRHFRKSCSLPRDIGTRIFDARSSNKDSGSYFQFNKCNTLTSIQQRLPSQCWYSLSRCLIFECAWIF